MEKKLFKYDFFNLNKGLLIIYLVTFITTLVVLISLSFNSDFAIALRAVFKDFTLISIFLSLVVPYVLCLVRLKKSLYKNEAYFSNALPLRRDKLFSSKMLSYFCTLLISWLVSGVSFICAFSGTGLLNILTKIFNDTSMLGAAVDVVLHIVLILSLLFMVLVTGLTLGYKFVSKKGLYSTIFVLIMLIVLTLIFIFILEPLKLNTYPFMDLSILVINFILFLLDRDLYDKGINLE